MDEDQEALTPLIQTNLTPLVQTNLNRGDKRGRGYFRWGISVFMLTSVLVLSYFSPLYFFEAKSSILSSADISSTQALRPKSDEYVKALRTFEQLSTEGTTMECDNVTFGYCALSSCTINSNDTTAACACFDYTGKADVEVNQIIFMALAHNEIMGLVTEYVNDGFSPASYVKMQYGVCARVRNNTVYPYLDYDLLSLPITADDAFTLGGAEVPVTQDACSSPTTLVTCGAAPCWYDEVANGHGMHQTITCTCGVLPYTTTDQQIFYYLPTDIGHTGGLDCTAYEDPESGTGICASNGDVLHLNYFEVDEIVTWSTSIIDSFKTAARKTLISICRGVIFKL